MREEQWRTLHLLSTRTVTVIGDLSLDLGIPHASMTRLIDELCTLGLVFRKPAPDDGRKVMIHISRIGQIKYIRTLELINLRRHEYADIFQKFSNSYILNQLEWKNHFLND